VIQNGDSWATAYASLQSALNEAALSPTFSEIWIAQGTYIPTQIYTPSGIPGGACAVALACSATNVALRTFNLPNNVALFGGFKGTETSLKQRNPKKFKTILSGNNVSWHVVTLGNDIAQTGVTALLDGLTVEDGDAAGPTGANTVFAPFTYGHSYGAGVYVAFGSNIEVRNVIFFRNAASGTGGEGGGLFSNNSNVHVEASHFIANWAAVEGGGIEILNTYESAPHTANIDSSIFEFNSAGDFGGALTTEGTIQNAGSFAEVNNCAFIKNNAQIGGAFAIDSIKVLLQNSQFEDNIAFVAGGALSTTNLVNTIASAAHSPPLTLVPYTTTVIKNKFSRNVATGNQALHDVLFGGLAAGTDFPLGGGAIAVYINGYLDVDGSEFTDNEAQNSPGGAILNGRSAAENLLGTGANGFIAQTTVTNSHFFTNKALAGSGGAIASLPSAFFLAPPPPLTPLPITVASTVLSVLGTEFICNLATDFGGAIFLDLTTATLERNHFNQDKAPVGAWIYGINSNINGSTISPYIRPIFSN
jgi:hypothetical protein